MNMGQQVESQADQAFDLLKKLGAKWAVLAAMTAAMARKNVRVPYDAIELLKMVRIKIGSGCFSPCEVSCDLSKAEAQVFTQCDQLDAAEFEDWCRLLAEAMQGKLDYERITTVPALIPVRSDCEFLRCRCSESN